MSKELLVIVPTRSRPHNVARFVEAFRRTTELADLLLVLDTDDQAMLDASLDLDGIQVVALPRTCVSAKVNWGAQHAVQKGYKAAMFLGDDNVCITPGWDTEVMAHLDAMGSGMVAVNDLGGEHERVATNMAITVDIIKALGWFDEPTMCHYYVDNVWTELGREARCLDYLYDVVIEHRHPIYRKDPVDALYQETMARYWNADTTAYAVWLSQRKELDLAKVREVVGGA